MTVVTAEQDFSVEELAAAIGADFSGDGSLRIRGAAEPSAARPDQVALAMTPKFAAALVHGEARVAVLWDGADWQEMGLSAALFVHRPRYALSKVTDVFDRPQVVPPGIHPSAIIDPDADVAKDVAIGPFVTIAARARIAAGAQIFSHCSIGEDSELGPDALLHAGVRIGPRVRIGARFIAQPGAVVGADGFSFVTPDANAVEKFREDGTLPDDPKDQAYVKIQSLGGVEIGDDVEMGANSTIDRGTIANTIVGSGTKIDNLVQIGHNAKIGETCLLCGQAGVGGSSEVGDRAVLAGQVGVADHIRIGHDAILTGQTGANVHIPAGAIMMGTPAVKMEQGVEMYKASRRLPRLMARFEDLQKRVAGLNGG